MTATAAASPEHPEKNNDTRAYAATQNRNIKIPGDVVNRSTAELPDDQRSAIRWYHSYCVEHDYTMDEAAEKIRYDKNTLYQVWTGKHGAKKENITAQIISFRELVTERRGLEKLAFIKTDLSEKIFSVCQAALIYQRMAFIFGDSQIGKTEALREYQRTHNHGETVYVEVPTGGAMTNFLANMAKSLRISHLYRDREIRRRIMSAFDGRMLLIVDEMHRCFNSHSDRSVTLRHTQIMEFIREIHDNTKCGVVISATNVLRDELETGHAKGILGQSKLRRICTLQLPSTPSKKTLNMFSAAYGLPPAEDRALELQTEVIRSEALGMWLTLLRMASNAATKGTRTMTWQDVIKAYDVLKALERA